MADAVQFMSNATIHLHRHDLPEGLSLGPVLAVDTEAMGLDSRRDRLCLVQMSAGDGVVHLVQIIPPALGGRGADCPNLKRVLADRAIVKLFHFARFDVGLLQHALGIRVAPARCTKIAAKLVRTYTDRHGLKDLCRELLGVELGHGACGGLGLLLRLAGAVPTVSTTSVPAPVLLCVPSETPEERGPRFERWLSRAYPHAIQAWRAWS